MEYTRSKTLISFIDEAIYNIPESIIEKNNINNTENEILFIEISDILEKVFKNLIIIKILSHKELNLLFKYYEICISNIYHSSTSQLKINDILEFLYNTLKDIKIISIQNEKYEIANNIKIFNQILNNEINIIEENDNDTN